MHRRVRRWSPLLAALAALATLIGTALHPGSPLSAAASASPLAPLYQSPRPGAQLVNAGATIAVRYAARVERSSLSAARFTVRGAQSGVHSGDATLADDAATVIFTPTAPFAAGERVSVSLADGLRSTAGQALQGFSYDFTVGRGAAAGAAASELAGAAPPSATPPARQAAPGRARLTTPAAMPAVTATISGTGIADGYLFMAPFPLPQTAQTSYLYILDNTGDLVYYRATPWQPTDFKRQPNGWLTYFSQGAYHALDSSYTEVATITAGNGYPTDLHELLILPNGHAALMIYDYQTVDLSGVFQNGAANATVIGLILQELDGSGNVVFEWRSWDHFQIDDTRETYVPGQVFDYVHGNAIEVDVDGNWLISSRHLDEITKINRTTGAVVWRMGGKRNQFTFTGLDPFLHQHDIRRAPNGHLTLFDNHNQAVPDHSRGLELAVDEQAKTVSLVREFRATPDTYAFATGSHRVLPNGNHLVGWGTSSPLALTEFTADGTAVLQMTLSPPYISYRTLRYPWVGRPATKPDVVVAPGGDGQPTTIAYSWNGATEVAAYRVYGGMTKDSLKLIDAQVRAGFETTSTVAAGTLVCEVQVVPLDRSGKPMQASEIVTNPSALCQARSAFLPWIVR